MGPDIKIIKSLSDQFSLAETEQNEFMKHLADAINHLIQIDFPHLVRILYRVDISESKLKQMLANNTDQDAGRMISQLLVERESEKIRLREQLKRNDDIPENEKW